MPIITDQSIAMTELKRLTEYSVEPVLDETTDLTPILNAAKICSLWVAGTAYSYGDEIVPTSANQNGRRYRCIKAGMSGSTEPFWNPYYGGRVIDGSTLVWEECGAQAKSLWDMNLAAYNGWLAKAAKVAPDFDFSGAGESYKRSQVYEQCLKQAARFAPVKVA
jgi:hypothetical protein